MRGKWILYESVLLFFTSFFIYVFIATLNLEVYWDEFYHILAARSWAASGSLQIADGVYDRVPVFTILVGLLFRVFGESIEIARLPSMLAGSLLIVAIFIWTRYTAGRLAAWIAALLFCFSEITLQYSVFIRFYALHGLSFWLGAISTYALLTRSTSPMMATCATVAVLSFYWAWYFQESTVIGLIGLGLWVLLQIGYMSRGQLLRNRGFNWRLFVLLALLFGLAVVFIHTGLAAYLLERYRWVAGWNAFNQDNYTFYHNRLLWHYPILWTLFPLAALIIIARKSAPGIFCLCIFGTAIILHSFGGMKRERYVYYAMPFFFVIWGIVLAEVIPYIRNLIAVIVDRILKRIGPSRQTGAGPSIRIPLEWAGICALAVFLMASNSAFPLAYKILSAKYLSADADHSLEHRFPGWQSAREKLASWLDKASVVLVTEPMHALYYLGRYDYHVERAEDFEFDGGQEFDLDPRTGRPIISTGASIQLVLKCIPGGLFVAPAGSGASGGWSTDRIQLMVDLIDDLGIDAEVLRSPAGAWAVRWGRYERPPPTACSFLKRLESNDEKGS